MRGRVPVCLRKCHRCTLANRGGGARPHHFCSCVTVSEALNEHLINPVKFEDKMGIDPKPHAQRWLCQHKSPTHVFDTMESVLQTTDGHAWCARHQKKCEVNLQGHVLISGFPCAPFSAQRSNRNVLGQGWWAKLIKHTTCTLCMLG